MLENREGYVFYADGIINGKLLCIDDNITYTFKDGVIISEDITYE